MVKNGKFQELLVKLLFNQDFFYAQETRDPNLMTMGSGAIRGDGEVIGIAVAVDGWKGYLPFAHEDKRGCLGKKTVLKWFQTILDLPADKIFHNAMYDVSWIRSMGLKINGRIIDTMIAASLINENRRSYTLDSVAREYAGVRKDESLLREAAKKEETSKKNVHDALKKIGLL